MWNLLKKNDEACGRFRHLLEDSAAARPEAASFEELSKAWPAAEHSHIAACERCRETAQDLFATREIFKGVGSNTEMARPWFSTRVMAAIAAREMELKEAAGTWLAVPKLASRLVWVSAVILLAGSTWLYKQPAAASAQEYLFEAPPPPINQDDVLISMAEKN